MKSGSGRYRVGGEMKRYSLRERDLLKVTVSSIIA